MHTPKKILLIALLLQAVWGLVPSASKLVIDEIPVQLYIALRWSISSLIFAAFILFTHRWKKVSFIDFAKVSCLGVLGYGAASFGTLYGLKVGGVTNFALMGAFGPVMSSLLAILILRERPNRLFLLALPLSVVGLLLLVFGKYEVSSLQIVGNAAAFILMGFFLEALVFVYSRRFKDKMGSIQYLAIAQASSAILMWIAQLTVFHQVSEFANLSTRGWAAALFVSVVACVLCYAILYWLLNHIDGHKLALFDGFHTMSATLCGVLLFQDPASPMMLAGGFLILTGMLIGNWPTQKN